MFRKWWGAVLALSCSAAMAAVDVNKAEANELASVRGIGTSTAQKIIDERRQGAYRNWADFILRVPGVGDARAARLSEAGLTVNGQALGQEAKSPATGAPTRPDGTDSAASKRASTSERAGRTAQPR